MKFFKKFAVVFAIFLSLVLIACGKKTTKENTTKKPTSDDVPTTTKTNKSTDKPADGKYSLNIKTNVDGCKVLTDKTEYSLGDTVTLTGVSNENYDCVGFVALNSKSMNNFDVKYVFSYSNTFTFTLGDVGQNCVPLDLLDCTYAIFAPKGQVCVMSFNNTQASLNRYSGWFDIDSTIKFGQYIFVEGKAIDYAYDYYPIWNDTESTSGVEKLYIPFDYTFNNPNTRLYVFNVVIKDATTYNLSIAPDSLDNGSVSYSTTEGVSYYDATGNVKGIIEENTEVTLYAIGKTQSFMGWYEYGTDNLVSNQTPYTFTMTSNVKLTAKWPSTDVTYALTTLNDNTTAGSITSYTNEVFDSGAEVTLVATANTGYSFDGWYNGTNRVSTSPTYTFNITSNLTLKAKWTEVPIGKYTITTVNSYSIAGSITNYSNKQFDENASVTLTVTVNTGYVFDGWYNGSTKVSSSSPYTFTITSNMTLTAKWLIKISTTTNVSSAGTYTEYTNEEFSPNTSVELVATTSVSGGYTFEGWYNGTTLLSENETFTYKVTAPITIEARWTYYTITVMPCYNSCNDIPDEAYYKIAGDVSTMNNSRMTAGVKVMLSVQPKADCVTWLGWYEKNGTEYTLLSTKYNYEYEMPKANTYIVAKFLLYKETSTNIIQFGYYPQTLIEENATNEDLFAELNTKYSDLPTTTSLNGWKDYGYYDDGAVDSYMWYLDVDLNNDMINDYRAVYFIKYRPNKTSNEATQGNSEAYEAGYRTGNVYWFRYDPVVWDVVGDGGAGDKVLVSRLALDAQSYNNDTNDRVAEDGVTTIYPNNYEESTIKAWLKSNFMYTAFDLYRRSVLCINYTDNSAASTGSSTNQYALDGVFADYVYLMSYKEAQTYIDGKTYEQTIASDYAKAQGVVMGTGSSSNFAICWLRSPSNGNRINAKYLSSSGLGNNAGPVTQNYGVRPVIDLIP